MTHVFSWLEIQSSSGTHGSRYVKSDRKPCSINQPNSTLKPWWCLWFWCCLRRALLKTSHHNPKWFKAYWICEIGIWLEMVPCGSMVTGHFPRMPLEVPSHKPNQNSSTFLEHGSQIILLEGKPCTMFASSSNQGISCTASKCTNSRKVIGCTLTASNSSKMANIPKHPNRVHVPWCVHTWSLPTRAQCLIFLSKA